MKVLRSRRQKHSPPEGICICFWLATHEPHPSGPTALSHGACEPWVGGTTRSANLQSSRLAVTPGISLLAQRALPSGQSCLLGCQPVCPQRLLDSTSREPLGEPHPGEPRVEIESPVPNSEITLQANPPSGHPIPLSGFFPSIKFRPDSYLFICGFF